jgi:hypothetical protein
MKRVSYIPLDAGHIARIISWHDQLPAEVRTNEDTALAASMERCIDHLEDDLEVLPGAVG